VALRKLPKLEKIRKATLKKSLDYRRAAKAKIKQTAKKKADKDLVERWRVLKKLGVYDTKENPALSKLTKSRRADISRKFNQVQSIASYQEGEAYAPLHKHTFKKPIYKIDAMGRAIQTGTKEYERYDLDTDHFQLVRGKTKEKLPDSMKTAKGLLAAKMPDEKLRIDKDGKVVITKRKDVGATVFSRLPISGPVEFLQFIDDAKAGRIKLGANEGIQLLNNGERLKKNVYHGQGGLMRLVARLERYLSGGLMRRVGKGRTSSFDDWASESGLVKVMVR